MTKRLKGIQRRDFLNGVAIAIGAGISPALVGAGRAFARTDAGSSNSGAYPPRLQGMRGSHPGSFEVAHDLAFGRASWPRPERQTGPDYDLVVVGGGISGLSAAYFYRQRFDAGARILILDNHDDFGGHAKRNEFSVDGKTLLSYGGSQGLEKPSKYSDTAKALLQDLGIVPDRFYKYYDRSFAKDQGLTEGVFFDREHYGVDKVTKSLSPIFGENPDTDDQRDTIATFPMSEKARDALRDLYLNPREYLTGLKRDEKIKLMRSISYEEFITTHAGMPEEVALFLRRKFIGIWAIGWDALSAMEGARLGMPGTAELGFSEGGSGPDGGEEPFIFLFPDGNASVARMLVRALIPDAIPGNTMEDIVTAEVDYSRLDREDASLQIRLSATAIEAKNTADRAGVDVVYVKDGIAHRIRGKHAVMACYAHMLPFICPELPAKQREAIEYAEKVPLVYTNVALRNWHAFKKAGVYRLYSPQGFFHSTILGYPVSIGRYKYPSSPDEPIIAVMQHVPITPGKGFTAKEQSRLGRQKLYEMTFDDFEQRIADQLSRSLGPYGFEADRDIAGIMVNRWPHGYAYEYNELEDDWSYNVNNGPHITGRARLGRITMANSDSQAYAYLDGAVNAADLAVNELLAL